MVGNNDQGRFACQCALLDGCPNTSDKLIMFNHLEQMRPAIANMVGYMIKA